MWINGVLGPRLIIFDVPLILYKWEVGFDQYQATGQDAQLFLSFLLSMSSLGEGGWRLGMAH